MVRITPCAPHMLKYYIQVRNQYHNETFGANDPIFIKRNGKTVSYDNLNNFMHNTICAINRRMKLKMNPSNYTPHTLRTGGCTDMARKGYPAHIIESQGRWSSKMWKDTYVNMDWSDMARLADCTVSELKKRMMSKPYSD